MATATEGAASPTGSNLVLSVLPKDTTEDSGCAQIQILRTWKYAIWSFWRHDTDKVCPKLLNIEAYLK